jgi:hypothetical protein
MHDFWCFSGNFNYFYCLFDDTYFVKTPRSGVFPIDISIYIHYYHRAYFNMNSVFTTLNGYDLKSIRTGYG